MTAETESGTTVRASELEQGDDVTVHVNNRAAGHLGRQSFEATVKWACATGTSVTFEPHDEEMNESPTNTWYADIGYISGYHDGLGRNSDIGKVTKVTR